MQILYRGLGLANDLLSRIETRLERQTVLSRPVDVDVVLTKACNFACTFCKDYETPIGSKRVSQEDFERVARQLFPFARRLNICSGGEPYLHKGLEDMLRVAKRYGLFTWLLSNGSVFREDRFRAIVEEGLVSEHGFSVDGFKAETVESIRLNGKLPVILNTITSLQRMRDEAGRKKPEITIRYALMRRNIEEAPDAIRMWGDLGIDRINFGFLSLANEISKDELLFYHQPITEKVLEECRRVAEAYPDLDVRLPDTIAEEKNKPVQKCDSPWRFAMIDTNGQVLPCYRSFEAMRMPSLHGESGEQFGAVWNGASYRRLRETVNAKTEKYFPYCEICEQRCGWGEERVHLGDETWLETVRDWLPEEINHKRPLKGTAGREAAAKSRPLAAEQTAARLGSTEPKRHDVKAAENTVEPA